MENKTSQGQSNADRKQERPENHVESGIGIEDVRFILDRTILILWLISGVLAITTNVTGFVLGTAILTCVTVLLTVVDIILYFHWHTRIIAWVIFVGLVYLAMRMAAFVVDEVEKSQRALREPETRGQLTPGNAPMPYDLCPEDPPKWHAPPPDATLIFLGSVETWWPSHINEAILVSLNGEPMLTFSKERNGLNISALIFDARGMIIAKVQHGQFTINQNNYFEIEHPDAHTLRVIDQRNQSALFVHYLNTRAIYVTGEFHGPHGEHITITDEQVEQNQPWVIFKESCLGDMRLIPGGRVIGIP